MRVAIHSAVARNFAAASENKIHSDEIAKRFGFTGALVPGVTVFGHLAWPLTQRFGASWLQGSWVTTRFIKPAYHAETIALLDRETGENSVAVDCTNVADVLLATLECKLEDPQPDVDPHAYVDGGTDLTDRVEIAWDTVHVDEPFAVYQWQPDEACNREYAARVDDDTQLFRKGVLHPHAILSQTNQVLVRRFAMPAWIHTGSEVRFRRLLRVGDPIEVRAVPLEKWERKGHQFIKLYVAYAVRGEIATEIRHTAIFRVATR
jgi:acyl dehydratase